jgi:tRNA G37 N-methylase Trm5
MARLHRLCLQVDDDGHEQRAKLFEWVFRITHNLPSHSFSTSTLRLIKDTGNVLYHRINTEGYKESQDDIQAVSGIAEDIRDALLDYQVCSHKPYATSATKLGHLYR